MRRPLPAVVCLSLLLLILFRTAPVAAGEPTDHIKSAVDQVVAVLEDPALKADDATRAEKLWAVISERFADRDLTRRVMGKHWKEITEEQRSEIIRLFTGLLKRSYLTKLEAYSGEKIFFTAERVDGKYAEVDSHVVSHGDKIPINYRMIRSEAGWRIYDVIIDGVSLVGNYRRLFRKTIRKKGYDGLIKALRAKQEQIDALEKKS